MIMKKYLSLIIACSLSFTTLADTSVWKASKNGQTVYLGGTIHVLRAQDYPLPPEFHQAYANSQALTFETDIEGLQSPAIQVEVIKLLSYSDDKTLKSVMSEKTYAKLNEKAKSLGLSLEYMRKAKPGMIMSALTMIELQKMGVTQKGIDLFFSEKAKADGKKQLQLETVREQLEFMSSIGIGNEEIFYQKLLKDLDSTQNIFLDMLKYWKNGNSKALNEIVNLEMKAEYPKMYKTLLTDRNNRWMPVVESYFKTPEIEFVLVGAAHLIGEDGLVEQLKRKGYQVTKL